MFQIYIYVVPPLSKISGSVTARGGYFILILSKAPSNLVSRKSTKSSSFLTVPSTLGVLSIPTLVTAAIGMRPH